MKTALRSVAFVIGLIVLTACGGGGDSPATGFDQSAGDTSSTASSTTSTTEPPGMRYVGQGDFRDSSGYTFRAEMDFDLVGAAMLTTYSQPGFAQVQLSGTINVSITNTTSGGRLAPLPVDGASISFVWAKPDVQGRLENCKPLTGSTLSHDYCAQGNAMLEASTTCESYPCQLASGGMLPFDGFIGGATGGMTESAARYIVDRIERNQPPDYVALIVSSGSWGPLGRIGPGCYGTHLWLVVSKTGDVSSCVDVD